MIIDAQELFSSAQDVTATAASTNYMDLKKARDMGTGNPLYVVIACTTAMTDSGSDSTLTVTTETDDNTGFSSAVTGQTIGTFAATSAAGTVLIGVLYPGRANERYLRLKYTTANGDLSTGTFRAFLTPNVHKYVNYADAITITGPA